MPVSIENIKVIEGELLEKVFLKPLDILITNINKYSVLPVYVCNFLISKIDMTPKMVLTAYDDRALITEISASNAKLEATLLDKTPATVYPTVVVFQNDIPRETVLCSHDEIYNYSTSYIIYGKDFKDAIKNHLIDKLVIKFDSSKNLFDVEIKGSFNESGVISKIPMSANVIKLPLTNYIKKHESYESIITKLASHDGITLSDSNVLDKLLKDVKEEQSCKIPNTDVLVFKDFLKQKPDNMIVYSYRDNNNAKRLGVVNSDVNIVDVSLETSYKTNKITHIVFYRYIENIVNKIVGNYEEL